MNMKNKIRNTALAGLAAIALATGGCENKTEFETVKYPIEQIFANHNGYTINYTGDYNEVKTVNLGRCTSYLTDDERRQIPNEVLQQFKMVPKGGIRAFKDLNEDKGYALILREKDCSDNLDMCTRYVEIHIPKDKKISPGIESYGKPNRQKHYQMHEIK